MKKLILLTFFTSAILSSATLFAQEKSQLLSVLSCDKYIVDGNKSTVSKLEGNVTVKADKLAIVKADSVIIDKVTNQLVAIGNIEFTFNGKIVSSFQDGVKPTRLEYHIGDDLIYIK